MKFESGRAAVLSIHGTEEFSLETSVFDAAAYEEAVELPAKMFGECTTFEDGKTFFFFFFFFFFFLFFLFFFFFVFLRFVVFYVHTKITIRKKDKRKKRKEIRAVLSLF